MTTVTPSPPAPFLVGFSPAAPDTPWDACHSGPLRCTLPARRSAAPRAEAQLGRISR
jgi:hypothetical protein